MRAGIAVFLLAVAGCAAGTGDAPASGSDLGGLAAPYCGDGVRDHDESGLDCGGPTCAPCRRGEVCGVATDCLGGRCEAGLCAPSDFGFIASPVLLTGVSARPAVADFDRDGLPDLAFSAREPGESDRWNARLLRGLARRRQGVPRPLGPPYEGSGVMAAGDLNGDGAPDLVSVHGSSPGGAWTAEVRFADARADGGFTPGPSVAAGGLVTAAAVLDVTGDRRPDLVVLASGTQELLVFAGDGAGQLKPASYPIGPSAAAMAFGDLDGDGVLDVAVASANGLHGYLGGAPLRRVASAALLPVRDVALGDLDGDGKLDAAIGQPGWPAIEFLRGAGDGSFAALEGPTRRLAGDLNPCLADFDGDGRLDLVATSAEGGRPLHLRRGLGGFSFAAPTEYPAAEGSVPLAADVDADGHLDLVLFGSGLRILHGRGDASFEATPAHAAGLSPVIADFDGDGHADVVELYTYSRAVLFFRGDGRGGLSAALESRYPDDGVHHRVAAADLDGDGRVDLLLGGLSGLRVLGGNGDGRFLSSRRIDTTTTTVNLSYVAIADVNGDGRADLVAAAPDGLLSATGRADGGFDPLRASPFSSGPSPRFWQRGSDGLALGDLDRDGRADAVVAAYRDRTEVMRGQADGTFRPARGPATADALVSLALADLDGDGTLDLLVGTQPDYYERFPAALVMFPGRGEATFEGGVLVDQGFPGLSGLGDLALADFNLDGLMDIAHRDRGSVRVLLGRAHRRWDPVAAFATAPETSGDGSLTVGDLNADRWPDLVTSGSILINRARE